MGAWICYSGFWMIYVYREYVGPVFPYWLRSSWKEGIIRIWDRGADVILYVDEESGEILVWRYRTPKEGGTVDDCFRTSPLRD